MLRLSAALFLGVLALAWSAGAGSNRPGAFDYYVLSLSWSPSWCAREGDARNAPQCRKGAGRGFVLHGLWPQRERGWPAFCETAQRPPSRALTRSMADIMGSAGLAWYQWKKHGSCTGLPAETYFAKARRAYAAVVRPALLERLRRPVRLKATLIEQAFLEENPALRADMLTVTCRDGLFHEVRICLTRDLTPRRCGADVIRDCTERVVFPPPR